MNLGILMMVVLVWVFIGACSIIVLMLSSIIQGEDVKSVIDEFMTLESSDIMPFLIGGPLMFVLICVCEICSIIRYLVVKVIDAKHERDKHRKD